MSMKVCSMMDISMLALDTYEIAKELRQAGFDERQAEAQAHLAKVIFNATLERVQDERKADKQIHNNDIKELNSSLSLKMESSRNESQLEFGKVRGEFEKVRGEIEKVRVEVEKVRSSIIIWVVSLFIVQTGFLAKILHLF